MTEIWSKGYPSLEKVPATKGFYCASVRPYRDSGRYIFQAHPHIGDWVVEYIGEKEDVLAKAEAWARGEKVDGLYSASW